MFANVGYMGNLVSGAAAEEIAGSRTKELWMAGAQIPDLCMAILQSLCMRLTGRGKVNSVAFSHDSSRIASASDDETVKISDAENGTCISVDDDVTHPGSSETTSRRRYVLSIISNCCLQLCRVIVAPEASVLHSFSERSSTTSQHGVMAQALHPSRPTATDDLVRRLRSGTDPKESYALQALAKEIIKIFGDERRPSHVPEAAALATLVVTKICPGRSATL
ncbi:hypothetical protein GGTG_07149 [Gaeumannomyces tritici R3-111a-1]|uniref:Arm-like repeat domain-containing protein n=1 Tax=Gaeumannomyces tritici (strain R3-111a-1) TaxID=644352 RepID=J3P0V3_GAET3|nr:hypothetical protein GGTG_07149 [Gaeumannomyces tritici R3-111a-1]EJT77237.1 hypothetical protein GGTG_07149 [Gaeumannomyces tritici R3-111a-1]